MKLMRKEHGSYCKTTEENDEVFRGQFEKLCGCTPAYDPTIFDAVQRLKNTARGDSGIRAIYRKVYLN